MEEYSRAVKKIKDRLYDLTWKDCQDVVSQTSKMQNGVLTPLHLDTKGE